MNCKDLEELLSAYADGELPRTQKEFLEEHMAGCADCRETLAEFTAAGRLLSSLGAITKTPDIREATIRKIKANELLHGNTLRRWLRPVLAIGTAVIVLTVLLVAQPWDFRTPAASAAAIVRNSPEVQAFFDGEKIEDVEVTTKVVGTEGDVLVVLVKTETRTAAAEVNLEKKLVTDIVRVHVPELTAWDEQKAIDIAKSDPRVQELLAEGGVIGRPYLDRAVSIKEVTGPDGKITKEGSVEVIGQVPIESGGKKWLAAVDVDGAKMIGLSWPSAGMLVANWSEIIFSFLNPLMLLLGIIIIIGMALRNKLAEAVAGVVTIALGILTLYGGLYAWPVGVGNQLFALAVSVLGLVIGITDIRRRSTGRWVPVTGIILCALALVYDLVNIIA
jgi:hypothetical protein